MSFDPQRFITSKVKSIPPSGIRRFFDLVANTKGVISLGVGEPDFTTPWHIRESAVQALEKGYTMYTSNYGLPELRRAVASYLEKRFEVAYNPEKEIMITVGASEAIDIALRALVNGGDEVLLVEPCYVSYRPCVILAGGTPVVIPTSAANNFKVTPDQIEKMITPKTKILVLSYPNNPTGAVLGYQEMAALATVIQKHDLVLITDEIYAELRYGEKPLSFASLPGMQERTILISGFSKAFAMTGWRIGYVAAHAEFLAAMLKIHQYTILCAPIMSQMAALEALRSGALDVQKMLEQYDLRRRLVLSRLREMGLDCFEPRGAFYIFPSISSTGLSAEEFAETLLYQERVAVVPGTVFGSGGEGHIRCTYATSLQELTEAMNRMERLVERLRRLERIAAHA